MAEEVLQPVIAPSAAEPTSSTDFGQPLPGVRGRRMFKKGQTRPIDSPLLDQLDSTKETEDPNFNHYSVSEGTALRTGPFNDDPQTDSQMIEWPAETPMKVRTPKDLRPVPRGGYLFYHVAKTSTNGKPINPQENYSSAIGTFHIAQELDPVTKKPIPGWARYPLRRRGR